MNQEKIGRFIAERRKMAGLTQMQLAEKLNITDRAVSKWETGRAMPDSSIMLTLCDLLKITVNDLLCGEVVSVEQYNKEMENNLLEMTRQKELADKRLLSLEIYIGYTASLTFFAMLLVAVYVQMADWLRILLIVLGFALLLAGGLCALRIEQMAGYYECKKCGHRYVPTYPAVNLAMHLGRTRYMRCPACHKWTWQKKVLKK